MGMLLVLMTTGGLAAAVIVLAVSIQTQKIWLRNFVFGGVAVWFVFYLAMLFGFSLSSEEKLLGLNESKEFCGYYFDCHMHTAVTGIRKTKILRDKTANGEFYVVDVEVFSDARRAKLGFDALTLFVIDENGKRYLRAADAENPEPPFTQKVPAGESFEKEVVFDLPVDAKAPRLDMHDGHALIEKVLVGDEDSIFHKRNFFKLSEQNDLTGVK